MRSRFAHSVRVACRAAFGAAAVAACAQRADGASWFDGTRTWYYETVAGGAAVTGVSFVSATMAIPSAVSGKSVVAIGEGAFLDADAIVSLSLPASLRTIGEGAFFGCDGLAAVTVPASVTSIGDWAFSHCSSLTSFSVASGSTSFSAPGGVLCDAACTTFVRWPGGKSGACAVPAGVSRIAVGAFCGADRVTSISLPASVTAIGDRAFAHCSALASFSVASGNAAFAVSSAADSRGALVSKDGRTLVCVPAAAAAGSAYVVVPEGVESVAPSAMAGLAGLSSVSLPASVSAIGDGAFLGCVSLLFVDSDAASETNGPGASSTVLSVGDESFLWCRSLREAPLGRSAFRVGSRAFAGCSDLPQLEFGSGVAAVGPQAFSGCSSLSFIRWRGAPPVSGAVATDAFAGSPDALSVIADSDASGWPSALPSGSAHSRAVVRDPGREPVFRFWSKGYRAHFYTISAEEKDSLVATNPNWNFEGTAYRAERHSTGETVALYRFYSKNYRGHFFTISLAEKREIARTNPNWKYEGVAYCVFPEDGDGRLPVYRFWSRSYRHHFYTMDEGEKEDVIANNPNWRYEGIAFFAASASSPPEAGSAPSVGCAGPALSGEAARTRAAASGERADSRTAAVDGLPGSEARADASGDGAAQEGPSGFPWCVDRPFDAPSAAELAASTGVAAPIDPPVELVFPTGFRASRIQIWRADAGIVEDGPPADAGDSGELRLAVSVSGVWHWLRAFDPDGKTGLSVWFRIPPECVPCLQDAASGSPEAPFDTPCSISSQPR